MIFSMRRFRTGYKNLLLIMMAGFLLLCNVACGEEEPGYFNISDYIG